MNKDYEILETDVLVIGGGGAGVRAAIEADTEGASTCLISKGPIAHSGLTPLAYPSLQAPLGISDARDNNDVHYRDIIEMGRYLCDEDLARILTDEVIPRVRDLEEYGVRFKKQEDGKFLQLHHPGQSYPRNLYITGGGFGLISGLRKEIKRRSNINILEDFFVSLLLTHQGEIVGAFGVNLQDGRFYAIKAKATVLACGGYEELWGLTDTAPDSTGDGIFLAFQAGADIIDMEMALYYPAAFAYPESLRGVLVQYETFLARDKLDFRLVNNEGNEFLPEGPLPVRDTLMRLIFTEIEEGRGTEHNAIYIDPTLSSKSPEQIEETIDLLVKIPNQNLKQQGVDIRNDHMEIAPAIHYTLGGIHINSKTESTMPGLFAAGENASNVHGANRISGNALAETQVFGRRAGLYAAKRARKQGKINFSPEEISGEIQRLNQFGQRKKNGVRAFTVRNEMKQIMDRYAGPKRNEEGLKKALQSILNLKRNSLPRIQVSTGGVFNTNWRDAIEISTALDLAELVIRSALHRKETRGHHFRDDFPKTADTDQHTLAKQNGQDVAVTYKPVRKLSGRGATGGK